MISPVRFTGATRHVLSGLLVLIALLTAGFLWLRPPPVPLTHSAYLWQREWTDGVRAALQRNQPFIAEWAVLAAEVEFRANAAPRVARVAPDYAALRDSGRPISFAIRVGPYPGPFDRSRPETGFLLNLARETLQDARQHGIEPAALHLDFDAATRQLDHYRLWLEALREAIAPTPLVFTALPTWLNGAAFARLVQAAASYVLQVHSWAAPQTPDQPFTLCDPERAQHAITQAARLNRPFQVALPTYGYRAWFDGQNRLLGLSAEGPALTAADNAQVREVRADPVEMAGLVSWLQNRRFEALRGVIWYRLPLPDDRLSWHERTWQTVMRGQAPAAKTELKLERSADGLVEVAVQATGDADSVLDRPVRLDWRQARLMAADGLAGFTIQRIAPDAQRLQPPHQQSLRLAPGQQILIGWLRFDHLPEISAHVDLSPAR
ncbi:MAG: DUF3142 domain-containing protein [Candidatus Competibacteraceae bacterium]